MANESKDQLLHKLQQRFEGYEGEDSSEAAWADFSQAYLKSKNNRTYYKLLSILLVTLLGTVITIWGLNSSQPAIQNSPNTQPESTQQSSTNSKKTKTADYNTPPVSNTQLVSGTNNTQAIAITEDINQGDPDTQKAIQSNAQTVSQSTVQPDIKATPRTSAAIPNEAPSTFNTTPETIVYQPQVKPITEISRSTPQLKLGVSLRALPLATFVADSTRTKPPHVKNAWYLDISYLATQSFVPVQAYPSDRILSGFSIGMGYPLSPKLTLNMGYQFGKMQQMYLAYSSKINNETEIIRIDTSLFYSYDAKRIMMQVDTLRQTKSVTSQTALTLTKNYTWHSIPLTLSYAFGKPNRMLFVSGGINTIRVTEEQTNLLTNGSEQLYTTSQNKYLFAPMVGLAVYQAVYKQVGVHLSGNYLYYLPNALTQHNSIQLQTGIRIQF